MSRAHERYRQTDDEQTTDGLATANSEREREFTFAKKVTCYIDSGSNVDTVFLDFAKAFDKVPHHRLALKLNSHGIGGKVWTVLNLDVYVLIWSHVTR